MAGDAAAKSGRSSTAGNGSDDARTAVPTLAVAVARSAASTATRRRKRAPTRGQKRAATPVCRMGCEDAAAAKRRKKMCIETLLSDVDAKVGPAPAVAVSADKREVGKVKARSGENDSGACKAATDGAGREGSKSRCAKRACSSGPGGADCLSGPQRRILGPVHYDGLVQARTAVARFLALRAAAAAAMSHAQKK